jgi:hypothetical protein
MSNRNIFLMCLITAILFFMSIDLVRAQDSQAVKKSTGNDELEFIFVGHCKAGGSYRIFSYDKVINGSKQSFYDYQGPLGQETIKSEMPPKDVVALVCRVSPKV